MKCLECSSLISYNFIKEYLGEDLVILEEIATKKLLGENFIICANLSCKEKYYLKEEL